MNLTTMLIAPPGGRAYYTRYLDNKQGYIVSTELALAAEDKAQQQQCTNSLV